VFVYWRIVTIGFMFIVCFKRAIIDLINNIIKTILHIIIISMNNF